MNKWLKWWMVFNVVATIIWLVLGLPTLLWWKNVIAWVAWMSLYANFASHLACCMALLIGKLEEERNGRIEGKLDKIQTELSQVKAEVNQVRIAFEDQNRVFKQLIGQLVVQNAQKSVPWVGQGPNQDLHGKEE